MLFLQVQQERTIRLKEYIGGGCGGSFTADTLSVISGVSLLVCHTHLIDVYESLYCC